MAGAPLFASVDQAVIDGIGARGAVDAALQATVGGIGGDGAIGAGAEDAVDAAVIVTGAGKLALDRAAFRRAIAFEGLCCGGGGQAGA